MKYIFIYGLFSLNLLAKPRTQAQFFGLLIGFSAMFLSTACANKEFATKSSAATKSSNIDLNQYMDFIDPHYFANSDAIALEEISYVDNKMTRCPNLNRGTYHGVMLQSFRMGFMASGIFNAMTVAGRIAYQSSVAPSTEETLTKVVIYQELLAQTLKGAQKDIDTHRTRLKPVECVSLEHLISAYNLGAKSALSIAPEDWPNNFAFREGWLAEETRDR